MPNQSEISQSEFVKSWFQRHPNEDIPHAVSKSAIEDEWQELTGRRFEDSDRAIRHLAQDGLLIKIKKGVYRYEPNNVTNRRLEDFSDADKRAILENDSYRCVICGLGRSSGVELHVDHIKPKELGGTGDISNGQTLCASHNYLKKISSQTETGKRMFIRLLELVQVGDDDNKAKITEFCEDILAVFDKHGVNGHIEWTKKNG